MVNSRLRGDCHTGQRSALGLDLHSSWVTPSQPSCYESIWWLNNNYGAFRPSAFINLTFAITLKNRPTLNVGLSYWITCTRFSLNSRNRSASGALPKPPTGALPLDTAGGLPFLRHFLYVHPLVKFLNRPTPLEIYIAPFQGYYTQKRPPIPERLKITVFMQPKRTAGRLQRRVWGSSQVELWQMRAQEQIIWKSHNYYLAILLFYAILLLLSSFFISSSP